MTRARNIVGLGLINGRCGGLMGRDQFISADPVCGVERPQRNPSVFCKYRMRYLEIIDEVIEDKLFHATSVDSLYEILEANEIKANTGHPITHTGGEKRSQHWAVRPSDVSHTGYLKGVSLTRSASFARKWKSRSWSADDGVVLVLDGSLIKRNFRIMPISFWGNGIRHEAEEFVEGPIKPVSRYLIRVEAKADVAAKHDLAHYLTLFNFPVRLALV